jgi:hypothetical protein
MSRKDGTTLAGRTLALLLAIGFLITRIVGYSLLARWLFRGGHEVEELLLPEPVPAEDIVQD